MQDAALFFMEHSCYNGEKEDVVSKGGEEMDRFTDWEELSLSDNFLFQKVMRNKRLCKRLIENILEIKIRDITYPEEEKSINMDLNSKSIRLDVYVEDTAGRVYDLEMQTTSGPEKELPKRTRYYQGMIDMNLIEKGADYEELNPSYIIFICTFDPFKRGLPMYTFTNRCHEDGEELGDETTKLFLSSPNYEKAENPDLRSALKYIQEKIAEGEFAEELDQEVKRVKEQKETRREYMTLEMELKRQWRQGEAKGRAEGRAEGLWAAASSMIQNGLPLDIVSKCTNLSIDTLKKLAKQDKLV